MHPDGASAFAGGKKRHGAARGSTGLSGERRWKYALCKGLSHRQRHGCKGNRHDQAPVHPRHHDPRGVRIDHVANA
jgi:hypothetical protein